MKQYRYVYEEGKLPQAFESVPLLQSLEKRHWRAVLSSSLIREYKEGEALITEGARDSWIYVLLAGRVAVQKHGTTVAVIEQPGEVFGELAVLIGDARSASVMARQPAVCLAIDWSSVDALAQQRRNTSYLAVYREFVTLLATRLRDTTQRLAEVGIVVRSIGAPAAEGGEHGEA